MPSAKLTLAYLQSLLLIACDDLRDNMDACEYEDCVFGKLFLKRTSDLFDRRRDEIKRDGKATALSDADIVRNLEDPDQYLGKYLYVPPRARCNAPRADDAGDLQPAVQRKLDQEQVRAAKLQNKKLGLMQDLFTDEVAAQVHEPETADA